MNSKNGELLGNYDVKKLLIKLSMPAILGMAVNALYNFVDTLFVATCANNKLAGIAINDATKIDFFIIFFVIFGS